VSLHDEPGLLGDLESPIISVFIFKRK